MCKVSKHVCVCGMWYDMHESMHACLFMCAFLFGFVGLPFRVTVFGKEQQVSSTQVCFLSKQNFLSLFLILTSHLFVPLPPSNKCLSILTSQSESTACFRKGISPSSHTTCQSTSYQNLSPPLCFHFKHIYLQFIYSCLPVFTFFMYSSHFLLIPSYRLAACAYHTNSTLYIQQVNGFTRL